MLTRVPSRYDHRSKRVLYLQPQSSTEQTKIEMKAIKDSVATKSIGQTKRQFQEQGPC